MDYSLSNDFLTIKVQDKGAQLSSLESATGVQYLWQGDPRFWTGQSPILFPICGSLRQDQAFLADGRRIALGRHGFARKKDFRLSQQGPGKLEFCLRADQETLAQYPFDFSLKVTYGLEGNRLGVSFEVENLGQETMPFCLGGHPAFFCPFLADQDKADYVLSFDRSMTAQVPIVEDPTGLITDRLVPWLQDQKTWSVSPDQWERDSYILKDATCSWVGLEGPDARAVRLHLGDFPHLVVWSPQAHAPFVALEPWAGLPTQTWESDQFEEKAGMHFLAPGASQSLAYEIEIIE